VVGLKENSMKTVARFYEKTAIILIIKKLQRPQRASQHGPKVSFGISNKAAENWTSRYNCLANNPEIYFTSRRNREN
jgi:hypothetical protein